MNKVKKTIIHVDMDAYFASVEQAENPLLKGKPVIVCGNPKTRTVVAACSYEAKGYGVKSGMGMAEALSLCPPATVVSARHTRYVEISEKIFTAVGSVTENIEKYSIDEAFVDVTDIINLYNGVYNICKEIKTRIKKETSLPSSCGAGHNKLIAKISSSFAKPDGIRIIEEYEVENFMENLPIEKLPGVGQKLSNKLQDMGITLCGDIKRIGKDFFIKRFGVVGEKIYYSACGIDESSVVTTIPEPKSIANFHTMPYDVFTKETINRLFFRLCEQVAKRMRDENYHGNYCMVTLRFADFSETTRRKKFSDIPADGKKISCLVAEILNAMEIKIGIRMLGVTIGGLFHPDYSYLFPEKREIISFVADEINERFGNNTIIPADLLTVKK
jgi:DNA polymerase IV